MKRKEKETSIEQYLFKKIFFFFTAIFQNHVHAKQKRKRKKLFKRKKIRVITCRWLTMKIFVLNWDWKCKDIYAGSTRVWFIKNISWNFTHEEEYFDQIKSFLYSGKICVYDFGRQGEKGVCLRAIFLCSFVTYTREQNFIFLLFITEVF